MMKPHVFLEYTEPPCGNHVATTKSRISVNMVHACNSSALFLEGSHTKRDMIWDLGKQINW